MRQQFAVYTARLIEEKSKQLCDYPMIVIKDELGLIRQKTGLEIFCHAYNAPMKLNRPEPEYMYTYPCAALNYIFQKYHVKSVSDINPSMVTEFLNSYAGRKGIRAEYVGQQTLDRCAYAVCHFFANIAESIEKNKFHWNDFLIRKEKAIKGKMRTVFGYFPKFEVSALQCSRDFPYRDISISICNRLYDLALIYDPMIAFAIAVGKTAGLRGGEIVNLRQPGWYSANDGKDCISFSPFIGRPDSIAIDLNTEYQLRSDGKSVGRIKRERTVSVYKDYFEEFISAYYTHLNLLKDVKCEDDYKPLFIGRNGMAMTEKTLRNHFMKLITEHLRPELLNSSAPEDVALGNLLLNKSIGLHVLRHCFTVRLMLDTDSASIVQEYRGDRSPESAETYFKNKSILRDYAKRGHETALRELENIGKGLYAKSGDDMPEIEEMNPMQEQGIPF